ncbi:obscurin isoform X2 [Ischnura elegans]|uniref:obscurin isoform X2 n=1 Tax=Ischnura elegans TaxID=197161 RepID=UPI001ED89519|nr:obscurin isoform X2 [Ischnura elegans]
MGRRGSSAKTSSVPLVAQAPAEVWPPPDFEKRRLAREAALQKVEEARGGRAIIAERKARIAEERPRYRDEDEEGLLEDKPADTPYQAEEIERKRGGGIPREEEHVPAQAALPEEIEEEAEDEVMPHKVLSEYRYVVPVLGGEESKPLQKIISAEIENAKELEAKEGGPGSKYVYVVDQYQCGIVLDSNLESAVRKGSVEEVMVSPNLEKVALRLRRPGIQPGSKLTGENVVTVPAKMLTNDEVNTMMLLEGAGPDDVKWSTLEEEGGELSIAGQGIVMQETAITSPQEGAVGAAGGVALVPGQVLETTEGPRFVPGQIVVMEGQEAGAESEKVHFIPGEVVETSEGPRFVAPDLVTSPDGKMAFSVQGFALEDEKAAAEKEKKEGPQSPRPELQRRLSLKLEGLVEDIVGGEKGEPPRRGSIVKAIVSEDEIKSSESGTEAMDVDTQDVSKKRRKDEDDDNQGQAMLGHLSKRLQTKDTRESGESAPVSQYPSQGIPGEPLSSAELELRVDEMRRLAAEAAAIGASLGLPPADAAALLEALSNPETAKALATDPVSVRLLRGGVKALRKQRRREMRRESKKSAGLISLAEETIEDDDDDDDMDDESEVDLPDAIRSSRDIPRTIFRKLQDPDLGDADLEMFATKILAGLQATSESPVPRPGSPASVALVILKDNLQAVIPREASRRLLTGNAPFTIIDETGIRRFKPAPVGVPEASVPKEEVVAGKPLDGTGKIAGSQVGAGVKEAGPLGAQGASPQITSPSQSDKTLGLLKIDTQETKDVKTGPTESSKIQSSIDGSAVQGKAAMSDKGPSTTATTIGDAKTEIPKAPSDHVSGKVESHSKAGKRDHSATDGKSAMGSSFKSSTFEMESKALKARWVSRVSYTPGEDDPEGLALAEGDVVELVAEEEADSTAKRARLGVQTTETFFSSTTSTTVIEGSSGVTSTSTTSTTTLLDNSAARHKIAIRPKRKHADPRQKGTGVVTTTSSTTVEEADDRVLVRKVGEGETKQGWVPTSVLTAQDGTGLESGLSLSVVVAASQQEEMMDVDSEDVESAEEAAFRRDAVIRELVETEEEFGKDLKFVVEKYLKPLEDHHGGGLITPSSSSASVTSSTGSTSSIPRLVRDHKDVIFGNFSLISEFHNGVLIEGFKYYANEPKMLGRTFLRLERDFDKHVAYCRDEPQAQAFLDENEAVREYFEEYSQQIGDDKSLSEHLKLPIQRINDYQLLLKELVKYSIRLGEDATDLQRALELMLGVPHRSGDLKFISSIEGYRGNIHKLGRLLRHEWFSIEEGEEGGKTKERYLFLFKGKILVCKVRRIQDDRSVFVLKEILKLPELELKDIPEDSKAFCLRRNPKVEVIKGEFEANFPLLVKARSDEVKADWLTEIRLHAKEVFDTKEVSQVDSKVVISEVVEETKKVESVKAEKKAEVDSKVVISEVVEETKKVEGVKAEKKAEVPTPATPAEPAKPAPAPQPEAPQEPKKEVTSVAPPPTKQPETPVEVPAKQPKLESPPSATEAPAAPTTTSPAPAVAPAAPLPATPASAPVTPPVAPQPSAAPQTAAAPEPVKQADSTPEPVKESQDPSAGIKRKEPEAEDTPAKKQESPPKKLAKEETESPVGGDQEPGAMDQSLKMSRKSSRSSTVVEAGETATFECELESESTTSVTWLKDNRNLDDKLADRIKMINKDRKHSLEIMHCRESDTGLYTALASNDNGVNSSTAQLIVQELTPEERKRRLEDKAPLFLVLLKDTNLLEGTYLRFMVKVKGNPNPEVRFYKDGKEIRSENTEERVHVVREHGKKKGFYELVITDVQQADAGKYSCNAFNEYGDATCEAEVTVTDEKTIFAGLGDETDFASGKTTFTWLRDGQPFDPEERFKVLFKDEEDSLALVFQHVKPEDAGLYTCVAQTSSGKISCSAELTVKGSVKQLMREPEMPKISTEMKTTEVNVGGSAMLELKASGYPKPEVKWYKENGEEVTAGGRHRFLYEDEESMSLVIKGVVVEDAGKYKIVAKNEIGEDVSYIDLSVKSPPKIVTKLTDMVCRVQETMEMTVEVEGSPAPDLKWYKDGQPVSASATVKIGSKKGNTSQSMSHSLTLTSTKLEDSGSYSVVATNELSQSSIFWKLTVNSPPKFLRTPAPETIIGEGESVTLEARVEGYPAPAVKWLKDQKEIKADGKKIKINDEGIIHTITLCGSARDDAGLYTCVATNEHGSEEASGRIRVRCPPKFNLGLPKEAKANEGDVDVEFVVNVEAYPKPNIKWYLDEVEITEKKTEYTRVEEGDNFKLIIREVTTEMSGKYSCKVFNDFGSSDSSCSFSVMCKPRFPKGLSDKAADEGDSLTLTIECYANPEPEVKWFKDNEEIKVDTRIHIKREGSSDKYNLTFDIVKKSDSGEYEVRAKNNMGEVSTRSKLSVNSSTQTDDLEDKKKSADDVDSKRKNIIEEEDVEVEEEESVVRITKMADEGDDKEKLEKAKVDVVKIESQTIEQEEVPQEKGSSGLFSPQTIEKQSHDSSPNKAIEEELARSTKGQINDTDVMQEGVLVEEPVSPADVAHLGSPLAKPSTSMSGVSIVSLSESEDDAQQTPVGEQFDVADGPLKQRGKLLEMGIVEEEEGENKEATSISVDGETSPSNARILEKGDTVDVPQKGNAPEENDISPEAKKALRKDSAKPEMVIDANIASHGVEDASEKPKKAFSKETAEEIEMEVTASTVDAESISPKPSSALIKDKANRDKLNEGAIPTPMEGDASVQSKKALSKEYVGEGNMDEGGIASSEDMIASPKQAVLMEKGDANEQCLEKKSSMVEDAESRPKSGVQLEKGEKEIGSVEGEEDEAVEALLKRVQKQRSVLEEILDKENGRNQEVAPEIISSNVTDSSAYESLSKVYEVKASGAPRPEAKWYKDGAELKPSKKIIMSDSGEDYKLEIKDLAMSDDGEYKCVVSNRLGEKSVQAKLRMISVNEFRKPKVTCAMKDVKVKKGEEAVLRATIVADPIPDITWYHGEKKLEGGDLKVVAEMEEGPKDVGDDLKECTFTLRVPNGEHFDSGVYRIHAKNKFGEGDCSARLDVLLVPEIESMKDVTTIPYENVTFKVVIYANPVAKVVWTKNGEKLTEDSHVKIIEDLVKEEYSVELTDIGLAQDGVYTVTATNDQGESSQTVTLKVHTEPPSFVKNLEDQTVKAYHDADFRIRVNGVPKPQIKWFKNGVELKTEGRITIDTNVEHQTSSLVVEHMEEDDEGKYLVRASNIVGDAETYSKLTMAQIPPSFARPLDRSAEVDEGDMLELKVKVEGSPIPTVKWFKDGEELNPSDHVKLVALPDGNVKLTIDKVVPTDCGAYKLVVTNKNGEKAAICAVAVKPNPRRPSFTKELENAKLVVGEPLKLEVQVMAFPAPEVKWFKDGHPVRPSQAVNFVNQPGGIIGLHMDSVRPEDAGQYTVTVANRLGEISGKAEVEVEAREKKPSFQAFLQPVSVVEGFPAKLEVKAVGHPKPTLKWTHNGKEIVPDGERIRISELPDGTVCLLIDKALPGDAGEYAVIAGNEKGDTTTKAKLDVAGKERDAPEERPSFVHELRDVSVDEGSPLILEAPFLGNPIPDVKWMKDGQPIAANDRNSFTCDGKRVGLQVKPAHLDDSGQYECILTNPIGSASSSAKAAVRKIYQAPKFTQTFGNLQQLPTFDAKFPVKVTGFPTPELTWFKNGVPINAAKNPDKYRIRRDGDACCLFVKECVPDDAGIYSCKAVNLDGEATCEAKLEVVDKIEKGPKGEAPSFLKKIGDCEVCKGMTAKFTACATGYPEPDFEWFHNGDKIFPSDRIKAEIEGSGLLRLSIANVHPSDVGQYSLRIYNKHGEDKCEAQLTYDTLESKPKRPIGDQYVDYDKFRRTGLPMPLADRPIISRMTDRRLTLSWKPYISMGPTDLRGPPVTYRLEMCEMPDGDWFTVRSGIRSCACDVSNLEPFRDYKFRVRVENKYGISDPSPFAITYREKLEPDPPKFFPYLEPGIDFRPETSPYFPKDFDIEKPPHDGYSQAPRFLRQEHDTQYGVKGHNCHLFWFVYGYPKPKMTYYYNDEVIEMGGRYDSSYTRNGQATLFINRMLDRDVGWYEAVARNEHGEARQRVRLEIAEFPKFITRPEEIVVLLRRSGRLEARVTGVPYPEIKWYKDWQPLAASSRIRMMFHPPDTCILSMGDVINRDEGLYSISARNVAGSVSASAMIHIEEDENEYGIRTYGRHGMGRPEIKPRAGDGPKGFNELYDIGDELGRGTQGITYHAVERLTGRNYAAKIMHGKGNMRPFMYNELEILNLLNHRKILRLHEAFETKINLSLILELASGGEFFDILSKQSFYTESEIAGYVRQILWALEHMHEHSIAHLGLNPGDILFSHPGGDEVKICDFGLARRISLGKLASLSYGVPEFVAPEVANGDGVSFSADMWSLGIIIYILLSGGTSLFRGRNDKETLEKIKSLYESKESFLSGMPDYLSTEARDFITKLLLVNTERRMDVRTALNHPWLVRADRMFPDEYQIPTSGLKTYLSGFRDWYSNASCRKWFRRRPLEGAYTDPSKMVYPPGMPETPPDTPRVSVDRTPKDVINWDSMLPPREPLNLETGNPTSESHYQYGPDTYLLQLRDVSFPVRLREYMKVAANRSPGYSRTIAESSYDWRTPIIRERRRFTDVMDEEIDDERKTRIDRYGSREGLDGLPDGLGNELPIGAPTPRRLRRELGTRLDAHAEAEAYMEAKKEGQLPFFREKPQILPIREQHPAELVCLAVGDPKPLVQWFKNDLVITENSRVKIIEDGDGRSILRLEPALSFDVGIYKVVARNKIGQTVARTRMVLATTPGAPDSPEASDVSDTEILLKWKQPRDDGNSPVLCYSLQYKQSDALDWIELASNIDHEFYLISGLKPNTSYHFRLAAYNHIGWSHKGIPTELVKTKEEGAPKVQISRAMRHLQQITESGAKIDVDDAKHHIDYSVENNPPAWSEGVVSDKFSLISEINRGRFSSVVKALDKSTDKVVAAKIFEWKQAPPTSSSDGPVTNGVPKEGGDRGTETSEAAVQREFEVLRTLRHERIAFLESAWHGGGIAGFIMEKLQGADIVTFLSSRHEYTEQMVATIITQVLDALQYLHWRGYCHLDIQPDNIVMASVRSVQIKLVDFGSAQRVTRLGSCVRQVGHPEYAAPEIQSDDPVAFPQSDIWSVGVITYILLSGESPFKGSTPEETHQNVSFVRFRFEHLFKELTQEATRFIMLVFKKAPSKRPLAEECHEHRWLLPTEFMIKKRERAVFFGNRLKEFSDKYHSEKQAQAAQLSQSVTSALSGGGRGALLRSTSIQEELTAAT